MLLVLSALAAEPAIVASFPACAPGRCTVEAEPPARRLLPKECVDGGLYRAGEWAVCVPDLVSGGSVVVLRRDRERVRPRLPADTEDVRIAEDGSRLLVRAPFRGEQGDLLDRVAVVDLGRSGRTVPVWEQAFERVTAMAYRGGIAAVGTDAGAVAWVAADGARAELTAGGTPVSDLAFGAPIEGHPTLAVVAGGRVRVWAEGSSRTIAPQCPSASPAGPRVRWSADGTSLRVSDRRGRTIAGWPPSPAEGGAHREVILSVAFAPEGTLITASAGGWTEWSVPEGRAIASASAALPLVALTHDGSRVLACDADRMVVTRREGGAGWSFPASPTVRLSADGRSALSAATIWREGEPAGAPIAAAADWLSSDGEAVFGVRSGVELARTGRDGAVDTAEIRYSPGSEAVATPAVLWLGTLPGVMRWEVGAEPVLLEDSDWRALALSPSGGVAVAGRGGIAVWSAEGEPLLRLPGNARDPPGFAPPAWSADGRRLATVSEAGVVTVWEL